MSITICEITDDDFDSLFNVSEYGDFILDSLETYVSSSSFETQEQLPGPDPPDMFDVKDFDNKPRTHNWKALKLGTYDIKQPFDDMIKCDRRDAYCQTDISVPLDADIIKVHKQQVQCRTSRA